MNVSLVCMAELIALVTAGAALAGQDDAEALIREGNELRRAGQNEKALPLFQRAYELSPTPRTAGQLGLAEFAVERYVEADSHLVEGLRGRSDPWVAKYRSTLEQALADIRSRVAHVEVAGTPVGAEVTVNGRMVGRLPRTPTVAVNPGRVEVTVNLVGHEPLREVRDLSPGAHDRVEVELRGVNAPVAAARTEATPAAPSDWRRPAGAVVGTAGLVTLGAGIALRLAADGKRDRIDEDARMGRPYDPANGNWESYKRGATACFIVGGVAVAGGVALWFWGGQSATSVGLAPTKGGMTVTLAGGF